LAARRERLSYCGEEVRRHDPDRFLTALYAPSARRESLLTLYAFNLEIAKVRETVSEPMLGEIRLQWWREAIESAYGGGPVRRHAVVEPLTDAIREHRLTRSHFDRLIDARAFDLGDAPPPSVAALVDYAESTSATLLWLALDALGAGQDEAAHAAARAVGIAWAILGLIRAMPHHLRQGRIYLPADLESEFRVERRGLRELKSSPELAAAVESLAARARGYLAEARALRQGVPPEALPALLPAALADGHLRRLARAGYDVFDPRLGQRPGLLSARLALRAMAGRY
jgi:NADH dehydrogenase [ubiquinone] 1 alpha subcomplex assembly factor 6